MFLSTRAALCNYCQVKAHKKRPRSASAQGEANDGTVEALQKIVPFVNVLARKFGSLCAPTAEFAREAIMAWCEENQVFYCLGLAHNDRLAELLRTHFEALKAQIKEGKEEAPCRSFTEFDYSTLNSWSKARRVIGKAEILAR